MPSLIFSKVNPSGRLLGEKMHSIIVKFDFNIPTYPSASLKSIPNGSNLFLQNLTLGLYPSIADVF